MRSWASVLRVLCGSVCSVLLIGGGGAFSRLLMLCARLFWTIWECMVLRFCLIVSGVVR